MTIRVEGRWWSDNNMNEASPYGPRIWLQCEDTGFLAAVGALSVWSGATDRRGEVGASWYQFEFDRARLDMMKEMLLRAGLREVHWQEVWPEVRRTVSVPA